MNKELIDLANLFERGDIVVDISNNDIYFKGHRNGIEATGVDAMIPIVKDEDAIKSIIAHAKDTSSNPHNVTAKDINLDNVNNTADINKPVSNPLIEFADNNYINKENKIVTTIELGDDVSLKTKVLSAAAGQNMFTSLDSTQTEAEIAALTIRIENLEKVIPA